MNTKEQAELLIESVCNYYDFDRSLLYKKNGLKPIRLIIKRIDKKKVKIDLSSIKMALSYILTKYTAIPVEVIGPMVGYSDHTTIPYAKRKVENYLEIEDDKFMPYWENINNLIDDIGFKKDMIRQSMVKVIHMIPNYSACT